MLRFEALMLLFRTMHGAFRNIQASFRTIDAVFRSTRTYEFETVSVIKADSAGNPMINNQ
jgi:hypothetical protein